MLHSYFFAIVASMTITFHRILVVAFPDYSNKLITERFVRCYLLVYIILYLLCIASSLTPIVGAYFKPGKLNWGLDHAKPYSDIVIGTMNIISNYIIGYVNMVVYTVLLAYLFMTKRISFQTTTEKRMTIQVALMIIFEFGFYVGFELLNRGDTTGTESLIAQNLNLLFFDSIILPYLILCRNIHNELRKIGNPNPARPAKMVALKVKQPKPPIKQHVIRTRTNADLV
ncbi:hypothetical protein WR25_18678 [Diploscapter pachys]|uniref:Uncharacterized protein n=1 Tax=Diploscapter pachys TaxID=2018661 RepID=A0A2A2JAB3_9BILA|nr:hypothetical protein WR25_18678 [Diploscapter pachys]